MRSRVCERVKEWAEEFRVSEDEIWDALRDFAEYRIALRISEFANSGKVSVDDMCKAMRSLAVEKEGNNELNKLNYGTEKSNTESRRPFPTGMDGVQRTDVVQGAGNRP